MPTGVPANDQLIDFERLKWLVANGYLTWWGCGSGPVASTYPDLLILTAQDIEFWIGRGTDMATDLLCPHWATVTGWYLACQAIVVSGTNDTEGGRIPLSWNNILGESGYNVFIQNLTGGGGYVNVATKAADVTTHDFMGAEDTLYNAKIQGFRTRNPRWFDGASETIYTESNVLQYLTRLNAPSGVSVTGLTGGGARVDFTQNSAVGTATHYEVYRRAGTSGSFTLIATVGISATGAHQYNDSGLTNGQWYDYYVRVVKKDGSNNIINYSQDSTIAGAYAGGAQAQAPTTLTQTNQGGGVIGLTWDGFVGPGSNWRFRIERMDLTNGVWGFLEFNTGNSTSDFPNMGTECFLYRIRLEDTSGGNASGWVQGGGFTCV